MHEDQSENEEHARVLRKRARLIDPELRHRNGHEQQRDHEVLHRFRLLAAKDEKREATGKHRENYDLDGK